MQTAAAGAALVGRERELTAIGEALAMVRAGRSAVAALVGEPGIGKSALLARTGELSDAAGLLVLDGRAAEHEADVPFGLAIDMLDDHVAAMHARRLETLGEAQLSELAAVLPAAAVHAEPTAQRHGPAERFRYHRAVRALLELLGGERPLALLLDDLHWADEGSLELLLHLLRRPPRAPHLFVIALRPTGPAPRLLDALRSVPAARLLPLEPLGRDAALALLAELPDKGARDRIAREARGNPLYIQELARVAGDARSALPPTLVAAVQLEVASLPPASRALLDGASVAGDPFDPELAAAAGGLDGSDALVPLDRLVAADLVRPLTGERRFRFRHPLVRRAVYDAAPAGWRLSAHERAAAALTERGAAATARAYHVEQSARPGDDTALAVLTEAGATSMSASPATAARWYAAALRLLPDGDPRRGELLGPLALALGATGKLGESRDALLEALALLPADDTAARLRLTVACAQIERVLGHHGEAERRLRAALEELDDEAAPIGRAEIELQLAARALFDGDADALGEWASRSLASVGDRDRGITAVSEGLLAFAGLWSARPDNARAAIDRGLAALGQIDDEALAERLDAPWVLGAALLLTGRNQEAVDIGGRGLRAASEFAREELLVPVVINTAMAHLNLLELPAGMELTERAEEIARLQRLDDQLLVALWTRGLLLEAIGNAPGVGEACAEARPLLTGVESPLISAMGRTMLAALELERDYEGATREIVEAVGAELERAEPTWAATFVGRALTEAALARGRLEDAERWAACAQRRASAVRLPPAAVRAETARAAVMLASGDAEGAATLAMAAVGEADELGTTYDGVKARLVAGEALAAAGDRDAAVAELQRAAAVATAGAAGKLRDQAARTLRQLGERVTAARPRSAATAGADSLTEREREIAALVAEGRSNKQVAAALYLSEKTIEKHLSRAFVKLGVGSRAELAAVLARREGG